MHMCVRTVCVRVCCVLSRHLLKNAGFRRQAASHLQQPNGPAEASRLLSVSDARVWSVDMEEMSLTDEDGGRLSLLFTAAPEGEGCPFTTPFLVFSSEFITSL